MNSLVIEYLLLGKVLTWESWTMQMKMWELTFGEAPDTEKIPRNGGKHE